MFDEGDLRISLQHVDETISEIRHSSKLSMQKKDIHYVERIRRATTRWVNGFWGLTYEDINKVLKYRLSKKKGNK